MASISDLHVDLIFQILNKMEAVELVRIRQTCKCVNYVAEKNEKKLASRPSLGADIFLQHFTIDGKGDFYFGRTPYANVRIKVEPGEYEKHLSGISIKTLGLDVDEDVHLQAVELFESLRPKCENLHISPFPLNLIGRLTNSVDVREKVEMRISDLGLHETSTILSTLAEARNSSKFHVPLIADDCLLFSEVLKHIRQFRRAAFYTEAGEFRQILKYLQNSSETITMHSLGLKVVFNGVLLEEYSDLPEFEELPDVWEDVPECIVQLLALPSQYALIHVEEEIGEEEDENGDPNTVLTIYFIEKNMEAVEAKLLSLLGPPLPLEATESAPKPLDQKQTPPPSISNLPDSLLFEILNKMAVYELVRMRSTCSKVNSVVEKYQKELAQRPALGMSILVEVNHGTVVFGKYDGGRMFGPEEANRLSAISIEGLSIDMEFCKDPKDHQKVVDFITRLRPVCGRLHVWYFSFDLFVSLTDAITFQDDVGLGIAIDGFCGYDQETVLSTLIKARNRSKFSFQLPGVINGSFFDKIKCFSSVGGISTDKKGFYELLWNIQNSKGKITMKSIGVQISDGDLFESTFLPRFRNLRQPVGGHDSNNYGTSRLMSLPSQFALIVGGNSYNENCVTIHFLEKTASAIEEQLVFTFRDFIYEVSEELKKDVHSIVSALKL